MKLMTVKEYAAHIGKSIPLIYKQVRLGQVDTEKKFGVILIKEHKSNKNFDSFRTQPKRMDSIKVKKSLRV